MSRIYTATFDSVAVSAPQDLFEIKAHASRAVLIHDWSIGQTSDTGDTAEELLRIEVRRGVLAVTSGSGGSVVIPVTQDYNDGAFGGTVETNNTTRAVAGSPDTMNILGQYIWNVRVPMEKIYTPETRPTIPPGGTFTIGLPVAPGDALTMSGTITFEELP
jgi:hypothetical protein